MMSQARWSWNHEKKGLQLISKHSYMPEQIVKQNTMLSKKTNLTRSVYWNQRMELSTRINKTAASDKGQDFVNGEDPTPNQKIVTVEDIVDVSLKLIIPEENSLLRRKLRKVCRLPVFRSFIVAVLQYFHYYLLIQAWEQSITQPLEGGIKKLDEKFEPADLQRKLEICQLRIAHMYSQLLLGMRSHQQAHAGLGRAGKSTEKEKNTFEILYKLLTEAVWITFSRTQKECIEREIGRLMRSEVFNRSARVQSYSSKVEQKKEGSCHLTKSLGKEKIRHIPRHIMLSKMNCNTSSHQRPVVSDVHLIDVQSIGILGDDLNHYNGLLEPVTNTLQEEPAVMAPSSELK
ncbi:protein phosphatase 1 regulatory subunit 36-like isoform X2 [Limulus polyphemus]|uniref:Protein phosphatase 1 regulatory subunit 36-like isoform X2 n=1 Tax=Limulus polyphemus TaxID=6850 RepID=A0ABM1TIY4_LIMPO|nr:protein phosphatase 1 regulatory subunit 36-like isoform X2 [Limulus polyphemus]